jgi:hypothetical protein
MLPSPIGGGVGQVDVTVGAVKLRHDREDSLYPEVGGAAEHYAHLIGPFDLKQSFIIPIPYQSVS